MDTYIELSESPLRPGISPVRLRYRTAGAGAPVVILHGGWGYEAYPFDRQIAALAPSHRLVIPDRSGYGASGRLRVQALDFHQRAAAETFAVIDRLGLQRPVLWGHSDGGVIALLMGLAAPERLSGLIVEAPHFFRRKPASREFFETMRDHPDAFGGTIAGALARDHGDAWRDVIAANGDVWLRLAELGGDLYDGRLSPLPVPVLVIHGVADPRTEPGELDALRAALTAPQAVGTEFGAAEPGRSVAGKDVPAVRFEILAGGRHSPHSERATADEVTRIASEFVAGLAPAPVGRS
ncbi:MAG TPA: alpha/beta hydrolase [Vicinamibacterales bacterium]|nr:alpha/beta hydrolase [Vicinamibacterales bacterium]